jgi:hypothetical protein
MITEGRITFRCILARSDVMITEDGRITFRCILARSDVMITEDASWLWIVSNGELRYCRCFEPSGCVPED